jgi:hypothetical protein
VKIKEKLKNYAKENNLYYENIAAYVNELEALGYDNDSLDALKHVIASAHSTVERGQWTTNVIGHANEAYAAYQARDNFDEHNKDHFNNVLGMTLGGWLSNTLGRMPTLPEIVTAVGVIAGDGMVASHRPKGSPNVWHSMASGDEAGHMASVADVDDLNIFQMAEEVFSGLTLDDWAIIPNDNDPFGNRDPFANGVKWVPGIGLPPANP